VRDSCFGKQGFGNVAQTRYIDCYVISVVNRALCGRGRSVHAVDSAVSQLPMYPTHKIVLKLYIGIKKAVPLHAKEALGGGERRYSSYSFLTSALDGVSGQRHAPTALCLRERTPVPIVQEAGWAPEPVWTQRIEEKSVYRNRSTRITC
jgi:hypothetical protein